MRWIHAATRDELAKKETTLRAIDAWWRAFAKKSDELEALFTKRSDWDLPGWMAEHLGAIDPRLMWEFGPPAAGGRRRLVITPESERQLRPLVATILERAPKLEEWEFYGARLADPFDGVLMTVGGRTGVDVAKWRASAQRNGHKVDLTFYPPPRPGLGEKEAFTAAFVAAESTLGEDTLDRWIGAIHPDRVGFFKRFTAGPRTEGAPLEELKSAVDREIEAIRAELPDTTRAEHGDTSSYCGTIYEVKAAPAADYPGTADIIISTQLLDGLFPAVRAPTFFSTSFSKHGETFCYLKIDASELPEFGAPELVAFFESVDEALREAGVGCAVGRAFGMRYGYVDVAVTDVAKAIDVLRALQQRGLPRRSWLAFHDSYLADEWVGLHDDSPAPPLPAK